MDLKAVLNHLITMTRWNSEQEQLDARTAVENHFDPAEPDKAATGEAISSASSVVGGGDGSGDASVGGAGGTTDIGQAGGEIIPTS